jgi:hypothetical protein
MGFYNAMPKDQFPDIYQPPLEYNPDGTNAHPERVIASGEEFTPGARFPVPPRRRSNSKRSAQMENTVVHSTSPAHNAEELCNSEGSVSPDFISYTEGKLCDMTTKLLWPLCSDQTTIGCFDANLNRLLPDETGLDIRDLTHVAPKRGIEYEQMVHW